MSPTLGSLTVETSKSPLADDGFGEAFFLGADLALGSVFAAGSALVLVLDSDLGSALAFDACPDLV